MGTVGPTISQSGAGTGGGSQSSYTEEARRYGSIGLGILLLLAIAHSKKIPEIYVSIVHSSLGRIVGILLVIVLATQLGFVYAILAAILLLLLFSRWIEPLREEGFQNQRSSDIKQYVATPHKWFLEEIMNESPMVIEEDTVRTNAIQDLNEKSSGSVYNSGVQNNSVQTF